MVKFLVKLFSKSLQGIKGGGAPFCSAQCATRSRKRPCQPKTAKRFFGGPGSQGPSGQAKERTRILPVRRGFSAPGVPCRLPGWSFLRGLPFLRRLLCPVFRHFSAGVPLSCPRLAGLAACCFCAWSACLVFFRFCEGFHACRLFARSVCCLCGFFLSIFALFCLTSSSQKSFPLSLRPRRASTFFRKESRQRFAKGLRPFEPHSCALRPFFPSSALLAGLRGLSGRKPPADGETLEKPRSRAQLFKRFCAKGDVCALSPISPFFSLLAGLRGPLGRKPPAGRETLEKPRSKAQLFKRFCAKGDACSLWPISPFLSLLAGLAALRPQTAG